MGKKAAKNRAPTRIRPALADYDGILSDVVSLLESARRTSARAVNVVMTATYWEIGRRVVQHEQGGRRAEYGQTLLSRLSIDLTAKYGRGFSKRNLEQMRLFYLAWPIAQTVSAQSPATEVPGTFPLPWSHYAKLLSLPDPSARAFYPETITEP
jgi:hypothetical protein